MKHLVIFVCAAATFLNIQSPLACETLTVVQPSYNLNSNSSPILDLLIERPNNSPCSFAIAISKGLYNDGSYSRFLQNTPDTIALQIWNQDSTEIIYEFADATHPNNLVTGSWQPAEGGSQKTAKYRAILGNVGSGLAAGIYTNTFDISLYGRTGNNAFTLKQTKSVAFNYTVDPTLELSVVPTGHPFNSAITSQSLDFGSLALNQTREADIIVQSNVGYQLSLTSLNNGKLQRMAASNTSENTVIYELTISSNSIFSGATINTGDYPFVSSTLATETDPIRFPIQVKILENTANKIQGTYADTITIDITAN